jgi:hypothetical protein
MSLSRETSLFTGWMLPPCSPTMSPSLSPTNQATRAQLALAKVRVMLSTGPTVPQGWSGPTSHAERVGRGDNRRYSL